MKRTIFTIFLTLLFISTIFLPPTFAQDSTTWHLPEGATKRLRKGQITGDIAYSPDGTLLAVSSSIGIWLYDTTTYQEVALLTGHTDSVESVSFSPDGSTIASGSSDNTIRLWDVATGENIKTLKAHTSSVASVSFRPDGSSLASGSDDDTVRFWDVSTGENIMTFTGHTDDVNSVSFSPDGTKIISGSYDHTVRLWDTKTGENIMTFTGHTDDVNSVSFSPDSTTLASVSEDLESIELWDVATGTLERELWREDAGYVNSVVFSPDGSLLAIGSGDNNTVRLWDVATGEKIHILEGFQFYSLGGFFYGVDSVVFSPDGSLLASVSRDDYGSSLDLWSVSTGENIKTLSGDDPGSFNRVVFSPDGSTLTSGGDDGTIIIWDASTGENIKTLTGHLFWINSISFSPDSKTLVSVGNYNTIRFWDVSTGENINTLRDINTLRGGDWDDEVFDASFSPDGSTLASLSLFAVSGSVDLWDVKTGAVIRTHTFSGDNFAFSPDGSTIAIASGSRDGTVRLWDVSTGENIKTLTGHTDYVSSVSFSPDGSTIASGSRDGTVRLWDVSTGENIKTLTGHTGYVHSVSFSPDGSLLASESHDTVRLWDVSTGENIKTLEHSVSFSPDGSLLASESHDTVRLWDVSTGENIKTLTGHTDNVNSVSFSPDSSMLASTGDDDTIRLWDVATGENINTLTGHNGDVRSVVFSPDGSTLASVGSDGSILLWDVTLIDALPPPATDEPGNIRADATPLPIGDSLTEEITPGDDVDYFSVQVDAAGKLTVWTTGSLDTVGELQNSAGTTLATNDDGGYGYNFSIAHFVEPGTYYVKVQSFVAETGDYTIYADFSAATPLPIGDSLTAEITPGDDVDFFSIQVDEAGELTVWTTGSLDTVGELQNSEGTTLATNNDEDADMDELNFRITHDVEPGTYYIKVQSYETATGDYTIYAEFSDVTPLPIGDSLTAEINPGDDVDYFSVQVDEAGELTVWTTGSLDTLGELQNSEGTTLAANDDEDVDADELNFRIAHDVEPGTYYVKVQSFRTATGDYTIHAEFSAVLLADVNGDDVVNVLDLILVAANFGNANAPPTVDVNGDGEVNREDILAVLDALEAAAGAPAAVPTTTSLQRWIDRAKQLNTTDADFQKGIVVLENLLITLREIEAVPKETALLANYPNPFNPETWIPYQLAAPGDVSISIYAANGHLVRKIDLGHQISGIYQSRARAAHWDGKNAQGEAVASGVYFYTLKAGDFSATRKMLIRK